MINRETRTKNSSTQIAAMLTLLAALTLSGVMDRPAQAQNSTPASTEELVFRMRQLEAITAIEAEAARRGPAGSPAHVAVLRSGLRLLGSIESERPPSYGPEDFTHMFSRAEIRDIDTDPGFARRVARTYETARSRIEKRASPGGRIVGGSPVKDPDFASTVAIIDEDGSPKCTGSYLGGDRILTAAHCVCSLGLDKQGSGMRVLFGDKAGGGGRMLGGSARSFPIDPKRTIVYAPNFCTRLKQTGSISAAGLDLAILVTDQPVPVNFHVSRLADASGLALVLEQDGDLLQPFRVAGFGRTWVKTPTGPQLIVTGQKFEGFLLSGERCPGSARLKPFNAGCLPIVEVSAFDTSGRDTCNSDSGGPLLVRGSRPDEWLVAGVTSRPLNPNEQYCGDGGIYALVVPDTVKTWMQNHGVKIND